MWIVFAHIATIFVGFALTVGVGVLLTQIVQSGDVRSIRTAVHVAITTQTTGGFLVLTAAIIGFFAATKLGYDLHVRWLRSRRFSSRFFCWTGLGGVFLICCVSLRPLKTARMTNRHPSYAP